MSICQTNPKNLVGFVSPDFPDFPLILFGTRGVDLTSNKPFDFSILRSFHGAILLPDHEVCAMLCFGSSVCIAGQRKLSHPLPPEDRFKADSSRPKNAIDTP